MSVDFGSTGYLSIAGTNYVTLDTDGRMLRPNQVAFSANYGNAATAGSDIIFTNAIFNTGSAYNTANGRFTAPVLGRYYLRFHQLAPNANAGEFRTAIYANGAGYGGCRFIAAKLASTWRSLIAEGFLYLSAGDYATIRYESGPAAMYLDGNYSQFSGHLIG